MKITTYTAIKNTLFAALISGAQITAVGTALSVSLLNTANAATKPVETQFIADVKAALDAKDVNKFLSLVCWDKVTPSLKEELTRQYSMLVNQPIEKVEWIQPDSAKNKETPKAPTPFSENLTVVKTLNISLNVKDPAFTMGNKNSPYSFIMQVGEKEGKLLFTVAVETK